MQEPSFSIVGSASREFPISLGGRVLNDPADGLRYLSEPWAAGERVKAAIARAAKLARLNYWRSFDIWYRKARRIEAFEIDAILDAIQAKETKAIRDEIRDVRARLLRLESILVTQDPEFHRDALGAVREQINGLGGTHRNRR